MAEYTLIIRALERQLQRRVDAGDIKQTTMDTYLNDASRVVESMLRALTHDAIEGLTSLWFGGD